MSADTRADASTTPAACRIRTILVPPDIVPVKRTSPVRVKRRTPWRPAPDGQPTLRAGGRDWFSDRLFVEAHQAHLGAACGTSISLHTSAVVLVIAAWLTQVDVVPTVRAGAQLLMPASLATMPVPAGPSPAARFSRPDPQPRLMPAPPPPPPPLASGVVAPVPADAPAAIEPETGAEGGTAGSPDGVEGGVHGGTIGGTPGGIVGGSLEGGGEGAAASGPLRVGGGIRAPRKIKDVRPVYPQGALADQTRGTVLIEAVVGADGRVHDARVIQSVPGLDQAALDAVRQWEFEPSRLDGAPVAVIITVIVQFAIH